MLIETLEAGLASAGAQEVRRDRRRRGHASTNESGAISMRAAHGRRRDRRGPRAPDDRRGGARIDPGADAPGRRRPTFPLPIEEFGRNAIQTAKQVLIQRVREAERDRVFQEYSDKIGALVRGVVQQVDRGNVIVKLDRSEGFLPAREQIPRDLPPPGRLRPRGGDQRRQVRQGPAGHPVAHPPGLPAPAVRGRGARDRRQHRRDQGRGPRGRARARRSRCTRPTRASTRSARASGSRARACRASCASWAASASTSCRGRPDPAVFVSRALSPARVHGRARASRPSKRMIVVVADDQLSLAIGKGGQNARLAARLTGWKIDLVSKSEEKKRQEAERASRLEVEELELGEARRREKLIAAGIETVQELVALAAREAGGDPGHRREDRREGAGGGAQEYLARAPGRPPSAAEVEFTPEMENDAPPEAAGRRSERPGTAAAGEASTDDRRRPRPGARRPAATSRRRVGRRTPRSDRADARRGRPRTREEHRDDSRREEVARLRGRQGPRDVERGASSQIDPRRSASR